MTVRIVFWGSAAGALPTVNDQPPIVAPADEPLAALRWAFANHEGPIALIRADQSILPHAFKRLAATLSRDRDADAVTPCDPGVAQLNPAPSELSDGSKIDRLLWLAGSGDPFRQSAISPTLSLWRRAPGALQVARDWHDLASRAAVLTCDRVCVNGESADRAAPLSGALDPLRNRMAKIVDQSDGEPRASGYPGLDSRPVILHIAHSWGGGADRWTRDFGSAFPDSHHLVLASEGELTGNINGERLNLWAGTDRRFLVDSWELPRAISSTVVQSPDYRRILNHVLSRFSPTQLVISSLIGHSLDCLKIEAIPTLVVFHDYYPVWPRLKVAFEADTDNYDAERLETEPFGERLRDLDISRWQELRTAYMAAIRSSHLRFTAPSPSVVRNLSRLDAAFTDIDIAVVPLAHRPFGQPESATAPVISGRSQVAPDGRWHLVVPGRISDIKGKSVLLEALPAIIATGRFRLTLLGAGTDGHDFFGMDGVDVILDYDRTRMPYLLEKLNPDVALMAVQVSETYSYTLSEMWSLGIPVIASNLGAMADRIVPGSNGDLFPPTAEGLSQALSRLGRDNLASWRTAIAAQPPSTLGEMASAYTPLLNVAAPQKTMSPTPAIPLVPDPSDLKLAPLARANNRLESESRNLNQKVRMQQTELAAREQWAVDLSRQLQEKSEWAKSLAADVDTAREHVDRLLIENEDRLQWAQSLTAEVQKGVSQIAELTGHLDERAAELAASQSRLEETTTALDQMQQHRDAILRDLAEREELLEQIIGSLSWRITRPMRAVMRALRYGPSAAFNENSRARMLGARFKNSMRVRGPRGTAARAISALKRDKPPTTPRPDLVETEVFHALEFPAPENPSISIVIPVYNQYRHTYQCLQSLHAIAKKQPGTVEIVVVDDQSSDETADRLTEMRGIVVLTNTQNLGFVGTCNHGAEKSRGEFILFLNNDTVVDGAALGALQSTLESDATIGLVGAKLVYPDGRLQEAGGVVFADGSGWNYGRFEDPDSPEFNFVRDVDYCSGAAIMIRRELWDQLGGFDTRYAPGYYEDTDLAFAVRDAGYRVVYQPKAVVTHFEGVTSGTDTEGSGMKRFQTINCDKFLAKWQTALPQQPAAGTPIRAARSHGRSRQVLIIDACTPTPDQDSGSIRMMNLMRVLKELGYQVSFMADNLAYDTGYSDALQQLGVETWFNPWIKNRDQLIRQREYRWDAIVLSRHYVASQYLDAIKRHAPESRVLFDTVDLHYLREERLAALESDNRELQALAAATRKAELGVAARSDVTLVVSPVEKEVLAEAAPELNVTVVSNIHAVHGRSADFHEREGIMFVGGYQHPPNIDAAKWFVAEIWPLVREELPDVTFHLIGSKATSEVSDLGKRPGVKFHGFVAEIEPFFANCRLAVAPLRYGAGVKGKVNSSMSYGQPVVATSPAVEGMFVVPGDEVLVADEPKAFAAAVVEAYRNESLWRRLSDGGIANVEKYFSFAAARSALIAALDD